MLGKLLASGLMARVAIWAAGQALPSASALKSMLHRLLGSVGAAVMGAVFLTVSIIAAIAGTYMQYASAPAAGWADFYWVITGATLILAASMLLISRGLIAKMVIEHDRQESLGSRAHGVVDDAFNLVVSGFIDGITSSSKEHRQYPPSGMQDYTRDESMYAVNSEGFTESNIKMVK